MTAPTQDRDPTRTLPAPVAAVPSPLPPGADFRLAQVVNYVGPSSGGLGAVANALGARHAERGGARLLVRPDARDDGVVLPGLAHPTVRVSSPLLMGSGGGHHVLMARRPVAAALRAFQPDLVELHDQTTAGWVAKWARRRGVPVVLFAHEHLPQIAAEVTRPLPRSWSAGVTAVWGGRLAEHADVVVCASAFAATQYPGARVCRIPFGVDLDAFTPVPRQDVAPPWRPGTLRLVTVTRLYAEKRLHLVLDVVRELRDRGHAVEHLLIGSGPMEAALAARIRAERLPVRLLGKVSDPAEVARLMATADCALALGHRETFALAVLEAMASGTPVVVSDRGAARELLADRAGEAAPDVRAAADAVLRLAADPAAGVLARRRAELYPWHATASRLLDLELSLLRPARPARRGRP